MARHKTIFDILSIAFLGKNVTVQPRTLHLLQSQYDKVVIVGIRFFAKGKLPMSRILELPLNLRQKNDMIKTQKRGKQDMANIYDGVFRTILNDCRKLIIPVINEIFGESYTGDEEIRFFPNEHFLDQKDEADKERITDTNFTVFGKIPKKYHVECESSLPDGRITIRLFEYDAQIALDEGEVTEETLTVTFPNTAVLYLRTYQKTPDKMKYVIVTPGGTVQYDIPIMKVQTYSLDDIFEKGLLMLIPFYIFSHEKGFPEYNSNERKLAELKTEYQKILEKLDELEQRGVIGAFDKRTIIELSGDVIKEIAQKYENVQKGVGDLMSGALIETEARRILKKGMNEANKETALRMLQDGELSIDKIAKYSGLRIEDVEQLAGLQTV